ncbi:MAG: sulfotransferase family 2 domain-containing protein [Roseiflexaceae bacterium]
MNGPLRPSPQQQLCFIHIFKTAGTSLLEYLQSQFSPDQISPFCFWTPRNHWSDVEQASLDIDLRPYSLVTGHYFYAQIAPFVTNPYYITMLRDPIERTISGYAQQQRVEDAIHAEEANQLALRDFIRDATTSRLTNNLQTRVFGGGLRGTPRHPRDLMQMGEDWHALDLELAKARLDECVVVGFTEHFAESLHLLSYRFGWGAPPRQIHLNQAPNKSVDLDDETRSVLHEVNRADIELYAHGLKRFQKEYHEMLHQLLTSHHYQVISQQYNPQQRQFRYDAAAPMAGTGWYAHEHDEHGYWRWSGPETQSTIAMPSIMHATTQSVTVEIVLRYVIDEQVFTGLGVSINGQSLSITRRAIHDGHWHITATTKLTREWHQQRHAWQTKTALYYDELAIVVPHTQHISERHLGVALSQVIVTSQ